MNKESDVKNRQDHEELNSDPRVQDHVTLKSASKYSSAIKPWPPNKPANTTKNRDSVITLEGRHKVPSSDTQLCTDNSDVKQSTF